MVEFDDLRKVVDSTNMCFREVAKDMDNVDKSIENLTKMVKKNRSRSKFWIANLIIFGAVGGYYLYSKVQELQDKIDEMSANLDEVCDDFDANLKNVRFNIDGSDDLK